MTDPDAKVRLDKWLWAARFFKTRALAAEAVDGGKVDVNAARAKRARLVGVGDRIAVRHAALEWVVTVREVSERRGSAAVAATLYEEDAGARTRRLLRSDELRAHQTAFRGFEGKPSKKERRTIDRLKGRS